MSRLLALLGLLFGFAVARGLDAGWVLFWYGGGLRPPLPVRVAADGAALLAAGVVAGLLGRWLAGAGARGIGSWLGLLLVAASLVDLLVGLANAPWWHEALTMALMAPAALLAAGDGPGRRRPRRR